MAKLFGMHELELRPGVPTEEFEQFMREVWPTISQFPSARVSLLRGDRGVRDGKYLFLFEFEKVEDRDTSSPLEGDPPEEVQQYMSSDAVEQVIRKWGTFGSMLGDSFTDYVVVVPDSDTGHG